MEGAGIGLLFISMLLQYLAIKITVFEPMNEIIFHILQYSCG